MGTNVQPLAAGLGAAAGRSAAGASFSFGAPQQRAIQTFTQNYGVTDSAGFGRQLQGVLTAARSGNASDVKGAVNQLVGFLAGQGAQARPAPQPNGGAHGCHHHTGHNSHGRGPDSSAKPGHRHGHHSHHAHGQKNHGQPRSGGPIEPGTPPGSAGIGRAPDPSQPGSKDMGADLSALLKSLFQSQPGSKLDFCKLDGFLQDAMKTYQPAPQHAAQGQAADMSHAAPTVRAA